MNNSQLINQDSGKYEYYTDPIIIEAARNVMGSIDLDPASSHIANETVKANKYFVQSDDGLQRDWFGNVWMNHPFSRENNPLWIKKLVYEYDLLRVTQACCITYAATSEAWFQPLFDYCLCFLSPRTNYFLPNGRKKTGVTKGSVVTYLGDNTDEFLNQFEPLGKCVWRIL